MKWIGAWVLSFFVWVVIAVVEIIYRRKHGELRRVAEAEGRSTLRVGMLVTGIAMFGIWCLWFS